MASELFLHQKIFNEDSSIVEMKVWKVRKSPQYPLGVRYSLYWVKNGKTIVGYDNHFPKGPHRHYGNSEEEYAFENIKKLIADFKNDLQRMNP